MPKMYKARTFPSLEGDDSPMQRAAVQMFSEACDKVLGADLLIRVPHSDGTAFDPDPAAKLFSALCVAALRPDFSCDRGPLPDLEPHDSVLARSASDHLPIKALLPLLG